MPNEFDKFAVDAKKMTDDQFKNRFSSLTSLNDSEISSIINDTGISKKDLAETLKQVKRATDENNHNADAIKNISKGLDAVVAIAKKVL